MTLAAPMANPPMTRHVMRLIGPKASADPIPLIANRPAASTMTRIRPWRSAIGPANQAPTAQPSRADDTTKPRYRLEMPNSAWIASTVPLMTAVS